MVSNKLHRWLFFLLMLVPAWPPFLGGQHAISSIDQQYAKADALYRKAIALGSSPDYSETEEEDLNRQALAAFRQLIRSLPRAKDVYDSTRFFSYFKTGELEHYFDATDTALYYYRQALNLKEKSSLEDSFFFKPNLYAGIISYQKMQFDTALHFLHSADKIQEGYAAKLDESERLYNNLGVLLFETGNLVQSKNFFEKAAAVLQPSNPYYKNLLVNYRVNIAGIEIKLHNYDAARKMYAALLPYQLHTNEIQHHLGLSYLEAGNPGEALRYFQRVQYNHRLDIGLHNDQARAFLQMQHFDSAAIYLQQAEKKHAQYHNNIPTTDHGLTLKYKGDLWLQQGKPDEALHWYQQALHQFYPNFTAPSLQENPKQFSGILSYMHLFHTLVAKAAAFEKLHAASKNNSHLHAATEAYTAAFDLSDYIAGLYDNDEARLFLSQVKYIIHSKPVVTAVQLYKNTGNPKHAFTAYLFDQRTKASALAYRQQELLVKKQESKIEQELKSEISRLTIMANRGSDSMQRAKLQDEIREGWIKLGKLQERLPASKQTILKHIPSVPQLQNKLLDDHSAIVSYNLSADQVTRFTISRDTFFVTQQMLPAHFREKLQQLLISLRRFETGDTKFLQSLHQLLIPEELTGIKRWIVVPDDLLHYLPFEMLVNKKGEYLVTEQAIQYQYATALLQKQDRNLSGATTLAMAPFVKNRFAPKQMLLPQSATEVQKLRGKILKDTMASKEAFLQNFPHFRILHLATHAQLNEKSPELSYIDFSPRAQQAPEPTQLFLTEINNLHLQETDLVILSACATAGGNLLQGEGVMSISRAFAYAGCANVVTTLWKAEDAATAYLTQKLHQYIQQNKSLDVALQLSKLDYLRDKNINPRLKNPAYWAHLVLVGDYQPRQQDQVIWWISGVSAATFLLLTFFLIRKQKKRI